MQQRTSIGRRAVLLAAPLALLSLAVPGCRRAGTQNDGTQVQLQIAPQPPREGPATATVSLARPGGEPIRDAEVRLEGNMSHAGMKPVFGTGREVQPGIYEAPLEFTMGGDWYVIVSARLPDGRQVERQFPVPAVKPK